MVWQETQQDIKQDHRCPDVIYMVVLSSEPEAVVVVGGTTDVFKHGDKHSQPINTLSALSWERPTTQTMDEESGSSQGFFSRSSTIPHHGPLRLVNWGYNSTSCTTQIINK